MKTRQRLPQTAIDDIKTALPRIDAVRKNIDVFMQRLEAIGVDIDKHLFMDALIALSLLHADLFTVMEDHSNPHKKPENMGWVCVPGIH